MLSHNSYKNINFLLASSFYINVITSFMIAREPSYIRLKCISHCFYHESIIL